MVAVGAVLLLRAKKDDDVEEAVAVAEVVAVEVGSKWPPLKKEGDEEVDGVGIGFVPKAMKS